MVRSPLAFISTKKEWKRIAGGIAVVIGLIVWTNVFVVPHRRSLIELVSKVEKTRRDISQIRQKLLRLPDTESKLTQLENQYEHMSATPEEQLPELLEAIAQAAKTSQVRLLGVKPKVEVGQVIPGTSGFLELPVQVDASGGYHQLGMFVDALERSKSFVRIEELKILQDPKDVWHHQATFVLHAYLFPGGEKGKSS